MKEMTETEASDFILDVLRAAERPLMTRELEEKAKEQGSQCPDSAARFLNKLRFRGKIKGELNIEKRGWIWWIEEEDDD